MRHRQLKLTDYGPAPGPVDAAAEWLLVALLAFMPLALGAVEPWSEFVALAGALALAVLLVVRRATSPDHPAEWSWAYLPVAAYLVLVGAQLLAIPESIVGKVSPETAAAKGRLLADLPASAGAGAMTLSFYPAATRHDLRVVLLAVAIFATVVEVYRRPEQVRRLLVAVTCVGAVVAAIALAQQLASADSIYWFIPTPTGSARAGPFVNHNHFAQFMNLSAGAALGLLLVKLRELDLRRGWGAGDVTAALNEPEARAAWFYGAVVIAGAVAVALSMSRGGMIGLLAAAAFTGAALARRRHLRHGGWVLVGLMFLAFVAVLYAGFDAVYDRVAAVGTHPDATGGRWQIVRDALRVWRQYPVFGTGLGTHAYVFPGFDRTGAALLASHVENEYVQALEETGALGLAFVLLFAGIVWANFARAARAARPRVCTAAFGLGFGLVAVMVHSLSDFGQHLPAVAGLSAVTCGLLVVLARLARQAEAAEAAVAADASRPADAPPPAVEVVRPRPWRFAVPVAVVVLIGWAVLGADVARRAASHARAAERIAVSLAGAAWEGSDEDYTRLLEHALAAAETDPDRIEHRYWLNAYRWRAMARERDPETGELLFDDESLGHVRRVVDELHAARPLCPSYGPPVSLAGQLELFVLGDAEAGLAHVRTGYRLAPNHPDVAFSAALADAAAGDFDASVEKFRRVIALSPPMLPEVIDVFENQFGRPDLAVAAAADGQDPTPLLQLSQRLARDGASGDAEKARVASDARATAVRIMAERSRSPDASPALLAALAAIYQSDNKTAEAIDLYRRAVEREYGQVEWRLRLARLLAEAGRRDEALREAEICLRLRPNHAGVKQLLGELSASPASTASPSERGV